MKAPLGFVLACLAMSALGQTPGAPPAPRPKDVASIDSIIAAVYDVISGPAGKRDFDRMRSLFVPSANLGAAARTKSGDIRYFGGPLDVYIKYSGAYFDTHGFYEREIHRHVDSYANIAQVFSTYESRNNSKDAKPFERGVNSFQLMNDGKRWWVVSIYWQGEDDKAPVPKQWLPH